MNQITDLRPAEVWNYFNEILAIPRVSRKEEKIIGYLESFAQSHGLEYKKDNTGNLLISKPAVKGMEDRAGIVLQSHVDMVGEKHAGSAHNFETDPIVPYIEDGWVKARDTTLGADDGIGVAASMAILASGSVRHGPLECLFTIDEESGMTGALGLQPGFIKGSILLNLDSEDEGEIFIGCAGGIDTVALLKVRKKRVNRNWKALMVTVGGLNGGHSGDEIHQGLGNSIKLLNRFLWNAEQRFRIKVACIRGGKARNAIPRESQAVIAIPPRSGELIRVYFDSFVEILRKELCSIEPGFTMELTETELPEYIMSRKQQGKLLNALYACPHGVIAMNRDIPGLVETSTNLASIRRIAEETLEIVTSQRSSVESSKRDIADRMSALFRLLGAEVRHSDGYPAWKPDMGSVILGKARSAYRDLFGTEPEVKAIHAGLECGLFLQKYPDLDMISFGPTIKGAHTPEERLRIDTVQRFVDFLLEILVRVPSREKA
ncbi:MAG: aminoacyl-histidine dipeptidase [Bacteroidetes bacterium]|nr:MAG: aminoacyl-histidine dipeptidase [Bacteroidota bacterium]